MIYGVRVFSLSRIYGPINYAHLHTAGGGGTHRLADFKAINGSASLATALVCRRKVLEVVVAILVFLNFFFR